MPDLGFVGATYKERSIAVNEQECVNWYPEAYANRYPYETVYTRQRSKAELVLYPTPGLKLFCTLTNNKAVRGSYVTSNNRMFYVAGNTLYEVTAFGKVVSRGTIGDNSNSRVNFSDNGAGEDEIIYNTDGTDSGERRGKGMIIVDRFSGYMYNLTTDALTQIAGGLFPFSMTGYTDTAGNPVDQVGYFPPCSHVIFIDGRFVVNQINSQQFYCSELYDGFHWNPLNVFAAEGSPDNIQSIISINNELYLIGTQSTEVWSDTGGSPIYQRIHGAFFNNGTIAPYSVASNGSHVFWLGSSPQGHGQVWAATNYQPEKISTPSIDNIIEGLDNIEDALGFCYTQGGHNFYLLTFQKANRTLCFDLANGLWHERGFWNTNTGIMERHRAASVCYFNDKNYVGDWQNGNVYSFDYDTYTDNGNPIRRIRVGCHIHQERKRIYFNNVEIDFERGVGIANPLTATDQGLDPQAMLQWSDDGGFTWSSERWISMGKVGKYLTRLKWTRMGMSRDRVFKLTVSDPCKSVLISANADLTAER